MSLVVCVPSVSSSPVSASSSPLAASSWSSSSASLPLSSYEDEPSSAPSASSSKAGTPRGSCTDAVATTAATTAALSASKHAVMSTTITGSDDERNVVYGVRDYAGDGAHAYSRDVNIRRGPDAVITAKFLATTLPRDLSGLTLLDIGCGGGELINEELVPRGAVLAVGVDINPDFVAQATRRAVDLAAAATVTATATATATTALAAVSTTTPPARPAAGTGHPGAPAHAGRARFVVGDMCTLPTVGDGSVDLAVSRFVLHYAADLPAVCRAVARTLRPGGRFMFITNTVTWDPEHHLDGDEGKMRGPDDSEVRWIPIVLSPQVTVNNLSYSKWAYFDALRAAGLEVEQVECGNADYKISPTFDDRHRCHLDVIIVIARKPCPHPRLSRTAPTSV